MLLLHVRYSTKFGRSTSNRLGVVMGVPTIFGNAGARSVGIERGYPIETRFSVTYVTAPNSAIQIHTIRA